MCAPTTRRLPRRPRATLPVLDEGSGYEREAAVPGYLGTGVPDYAEGAQSLPSGESRPEAARTLPQREGARVDLRLRRDRRRACIPTARRQDTKGKRRRAEPDDQVLHR